MGVRSGVKSVWRSFDPIDRASAPLFIGTMLWEARRLRRVPTRTLGDLEGADEVTLSGDQDPPDPLVPVGYEGRDTAASLAMLVGNVAVNTAMAGVYHRMDSRLYERRVADLGSRRGGFLMAMVAWDLCYYWDHRWQHEVRLGWANHVTHHSSERYNLSTALRQPWSPFLMHWVFAPMALLGFRPDQIRRAGQLNLLYQYWIHTEAIDRMPDWFEFVFNTPSHHRAHHGANRQYLDTNYAGILILWDRIFGSFEPEKRRVKYGLTKNIHTFNPARIGYHEFADIVRDVRRARTARERWNHVFGPPGWSPGERPAA